MSETNKHTEQEDCEKVVRCKNCKHSKKIRFTNRNDTLLCTYHQMQKKDMDFCSYGEQKESPLKCELFLPSYLCSTCTKSDCKMNGGNTASNEMNCGCAYCDNFVSGKCSLNQTVEISKKDLLMMLRKACREAGQEKPNNLSLKEMIDKKQKEGTIKNSVPVKHGHWEANGFKCVTKCSCCGDEFNEYIDDAFCRTCGAVMDEEWDGVIRK